VRSATVSAMREEKGLGVLPGRVVSDGDNNADGDGRMRKTAPTRTKAMLTRNPRRGGGGNSWRPPYPFSHAGGLTLSFEEFSDGERGQSEAEGAVAKAAAPKPVAQSMRDAPPLFGAGTVLQTSHGRTAGSSL